MTTPPDHVVFLKHAPTDLHAPLILLSLLSSKSRASYILDHGFTEEQIKPNWWRDIGIEISLPIDSTGTPRLARADLFRMSHRAENNDDALLTFLWHVLAWGSGSSRRNNRQRIQSCSGSVALLREAFTSARAGDPKGAYGKLIRPGRAAISHFGPAFFSKFLYFASEGSVPRCLILDARVSRSLYALGWSISPLYPTNSFSYNWYTDTYVSYCNLLQAWADEVDNRITPDMFERALFEGVHVARWGEEQHSETLIAT